MQFELWDSDDVAVPRKELLQRVRGVDALLCVLTEKIDAELLDAAGGQARRSEINEQPRSAHMSKLSPCFTSAVQVRT